MITSQHSLHCEDRTPRRRRARARDFNSIDYIDVTLNPDGTATLTIYCFDPIEIVENGAHPAAPENNPPQPVKIAPENIRIEGGKRIRGQMMVMTHFDYGDHDSSFKFDVSPQGDFSAYTLRLVEAESDLPLSGFDPRAAQMDFSFMVDCPSDMDCAADGSCPPETFDEPDISYLAKDYGSFRQLALDRLALILPDWMERHTPDLGITLVELLAYVGDYLSYYQDAVATEAYLQTARQRISVRRHARLVDYLMHEGCNARAWLCLKVEDDLLLSLKRVFFITDRTLSFALPIVAEQPALDAIPRELYEVFEPVAEHDVNLYRAHNRIRFYTWGARECCLPQGATHATLYDGTPQADPPDNPVEVHKAGAQYEQRPELAHEQPTRALHLKRGDVLIFEEALGPKTGSPADADPTHRHVVRLTRVSASFDPVYKQPILEVEWDAADALPFALCISAQTQTCDFIEDVSVACGNVILVDHGQSVPWECVGAVEGEPVPVPCEDANCHELPIQQPRRFRPHLQTRPLVFREPIHESASAWATLHQRDPRAALPQILLEDFADATCEEKPTTAGVPWTPRYDLLASGGDDRHYVVEMDNDGVGHLRFGDGQLGEQPTPGMVFWAAYRVGDSKNGNVSRESIRRMVVRDGIIEGVVDICNPLPAVGGQPPEPMREVQLFAPGAFRQQLMRAITPEDYATLAQKHPGVQKAAARMISIGGRDLIVVTVDSFAGQVDDAALLESVRRYLLPYRRVGHHLHVMQTHYVPLDVTVEICVRSGYLRSDVWTALSERLGSTPGGFFHPDSLTFGTGVAFSRIVAAVQGVTGVASVEAVTIVARDEVYTWPEVIDIDPDEPDVQPSSDSPQIAFGPSEIPLMANDPNYPERGTLTLVLKGGR
jgi:hypothetical protein